MIQPVSIHQAEHMMVAINGVISAHHHLLATVAFLKDKVQALEEQNNGLTARVAVLEQCGHCVGAMRPRCWSNAATVLEQCGHCRLQEWVGRRTVTDGVAALPSDVAEQAKKKCVADEKRISDRFAELIKSDPQHPLHEASLVGDSTDVPLDGDPPLQRQQQESLWGHTTSMCSTERPHQHRRALDDEGG